MPFIPEKDEILVFSQPKERIQRDLIDELTLPSEVQTFIGWVEGDKFQISRKLSRPDNFNPVMKGSIDSSSKGSIVFMSFSLMFSTRMFLIFWSLLLFFLCLFFTIKYQAYLYGSICIAVGIFNYLIVFYNFKKQMRISRDSFINLLSNAS